MAPSEAVHLQQLADAPRKSRKVDRGVLGEVIERICNGRFVTLRCLAELVNRKPETLRDQYLTRMVRERKLALAYPTVPTHERQAYTTVTSVGSPPDEPGNTATKEKP